MVHWWPPRKVRCKYGDQCSRFNGKHFYHNPNGNTADQSFSHPVEHVRSRMAALQWEGPKGTLYRILSTNGVDVDRCTTRDEMLEALERVLGPKLAAAPVPARPKAAKAAKAPPRWVD